MILIVDDNNEIVDWMRQIIQELGYYCDCANDATFAFYKFQKLEYALALIDIELPDYSGNVLAKLIRGLTGPRNELPLVAMSGGDFTDPDKLFQFILVKPFSADALHDVILEYAQPPVKDLHIVRQMWEGGLPKNMEDK